MGVRRVLGRYEVLERIATGGMATVYLGRLRGPVGFSRIVAIKELHAQFACDPLFVRMLVDEAQLTASIRHSNVVATTDVVVEDGMVWVVMDYVAGESLARLAAADSPDLVPAPIVVTILFDVLSGLHAAHEARGGDGRSLGIVHRDVSPHNVLAGIDGTARVIDFGVAKAEGRRQTTVEGTVKGKVSYMAPEQLRGERVTRQADVFAAGVMLWELLTGDRLFKGDTPAEAMANVLQMKLEPPSALAADRATPFDGVVMRALARDPAGRYATAEEMAKELLRCGARASEADVGRWVEQHASDEARVHWRTASELASASAEVSTTELAAQIDTRPFTNEPTLPLTLESRPRARRWVLLGTVGTIALAGIVTAWLALPRRGPPSASPTAAPTVAATVAAMNAASAAEIAPAAPPSVPAPAVAATVPSADAPGESKPSKRVHGPPAFHRAAAPAPPSAPLDPTRYP